MLTVHILGHSMFRSKLVVGALTPASETDVARTNSRMSNHVIFALFLVLFNICVISGVIIPFLVL
jgi:hypothetical protein